MADRDTGGGGGGGTSGSGVGAFSNGSDDGGGGENPAWETIAPEWAQNLSSLGKSLGSGDFATLVRSIVFRPIIKTILGLAATATGAMLTLFQGSSPGFSRDETVWGLADVLPAAASFLIDMISFVYGVYVDVGLYIAGAITPSIPGPLDGLILLVVFAVEAVVTAFLVVRGTRAIADAIPGLSGIETFVFG